VALFAGTILFRKLLLVLSPDVYGLDPALFNNDEKADMPTTSVIQRQARHSRRPNIIIILADDLGYGDMGIQGSTAIKTPNIDTLATEGVRFTSFYASAPVCSPSRAGLLTGRYPLRSGIVGPYQPTEDTLLRRATRQLGIYMSQLGTVDMAGGGFRIEIAYLFIHV